MLAISRADIAKILDWNEVITAIEAGFVALSSGQANIPLRSGLPIPNFAGLLLTMPGFMAGASADEAGLAVKMVSVFERNPLQNLPLIHGLVVLFEPNTGRALALFDGGSLTAIRTGAASGVATKYLGRSTAKKIALFGAGVQAETQLQAVHAARPIEKVHVCSRNQAKANAFCQKMQSLLQIRVEVAVNSQVALNQADIVIAATTSPTPVFADTDLTAGVHINGVGSYKPELREIPGETVARARVVVDSRPSALAEAGDLLIPMQTGQFEATQIYAELGEICAGLKPGRSGLADTEITFFKSVGNAVQDVALARYLYNKAQATGLGQLIEL
jgi:ornithine cyclodeaminase/alanine dehydrogenase-like protein (mu-crystallin family)